MRSCYVALEEGKLQPQKKVQSEGKEGLVKLHIKTCDRIKSQEHQPGGRTVEKKNKL